MENKQVSKPILILGILFLGIPLLIALFATASKGKTEQFIQLLKWIGVLAFLFWIAAKISKPKQQWVNFCGADDEETCEDCRKAMAGNPWPIDQAPIPGKLECGDNCRHALQLTSPPKKVKGNKKWKN